MVKLDARFLQEWPLYKAYPWNAPSKYAELADQFGPINMPCPVCQYSQTFTRIASSDYPNPKKTAIGPTTLPYPLSNGTVTCHYYQCVACKQHPITFLVRISDSCDTITKVGQYPPWSIEPEPFVKKALANHVNDYKKGLINESQGYGIGAFAYYRRIVEDVIETLLNDIGDLLKGDPSHDVYMEKLANVKDSRSAEARIAVVKDLLPPILRPGNANPLANLHSALSEGLHSESDEECLTLAAMVKGSLVFLIGQVSQAKQQAKDYSTQMEAIKKKLDQKGNTKTNPK